MLKLLIYLFIVACLMFDKKTTINYSNNLDKRNRNCTNIILPFTYEEITKSSRAELQESLNMHPELTQKQVVTFI